MGLDVTAYEVIVPAFHSLPPGDKWCENDEHRQVYAAGFPEHLGSLKDMECYYVTDRTFDFRAGSYGGYNEWRATLCRFAFNIEPEEVWANLDRYNGKPFYELINFSDCEGTIGPELCAKLAKDFNDYADPFAKVHPETDDPFSWDLARYEDWQTAFNLAKDKGCVVFH